MSRVPVRVRSSCWTAFSAAHESWLWCSWSLKAHFFCAVCEGGRFCESPRFVHCKQLQQSQPWSLADLLWSVGRRNADNVLVPGVFETPFFWWLDCRGSCLPRAHVQQSHSNDCQFVKRAEPQTVAPCRASMTGCIVGRPARNPN